MSMRFGNLLEELQIEGIMPERALLRLKRAGISLYNLQKPQKNRILFSVKRKELEKVFAIYPNMCYNDSTYHPYTVRKTYRTKGTRLLTFCKNRAGFFLGILGFAILSLSSEGLVLGIEVTGNTAYTREVHMALGEHGIRAFSLFPANKVDLVTAQLLTLPNVEFCSVQKRGHWVRVELRKAPLSTKGLQRESMLASHSGVITHISVLKGTPLKQVGDSVSVGDTLVGNWIESEEGEQVFVEPMARVKITCTYTQLFPLDTEEEVAFATSYLALRLGSRDDIEEKTLRQTPDGLEVHIVYTITQAVNF